jgi:hypothetical protein
MMTLFLTVSSFGRQILREQLSPFDIDLRSVERQLDFSDAGKAVSRFLANRNRRLFSMSTENALVSLLREGVSVNEESVDSKRDLEEALRAACNGFIDHTCKTLAGGIMDMVDKIQSSTPEKYQKEKILNGEKVKETLKGVSSKVEESAEAVTKQMGLYLDNAATQSILLKPISRKITKGLEEIQKAIIEIPTGVNGWDDSVRGDVLLLMDEVGKKVKQSVKASR